MISQMTLVMMAIQAGAGILLPIFLIAYLCKKYNCRIKHFFVGILVFMIFAVTLENRVHGMVLASPNGAAIQNNPLLMALYGAVMAGLFEEVGRYVAFRFVLNRDMEEDINALSYGAGHGGFECFYLLASTGANNLLMALSYRAAGMDAMLTLTDGDAVMAQRLADALTQTAPAMYLLGVVERCLAIALQMALSVLVWFSVKADGRGKLSLLALAIGLHFAVDFVAAVLKDRIPAVVIELAVAAMTVAVILIARKVWRQYAAGESKQPAA